MRRASPSWQKMSVQRPLAPKSPHFGSQNLFKGRYHYCQNEAGDQAPFTLEMAATISANSGLSEAPPTRKPTMSGIAESSGAFLALAEPPYWMRMASATAAEAFSAISLRMPAWV